VDRKDLVRRYKEMPRPMGVYRVRNTSDEVSLVGCSADLPAILNRSRFQLDAGMHPNRALQADWTRHGPQAFLMETLDTLEWPDQPDYDPSADLRTLAALWVDRLRQAGERLYNDRR
jgi:hypothetical protein